MATPGKSNDRQRTRGLTVISGMILVFTGIIPVCQTEDGLATVLSHGKLTISSNYLL